MIWFHRLVYGHSIRWKPYGYTINEATCTCGKRWVR